jgi:hypothetical protein
MSTEQIAQRVETEYIQKLESINKYIAKETERNNKYRTLLEQTYAWQPPAKNFKHLKEFMIAHLEQVIENDCNLKVMPPPKKESCEHYRARKIKEIREQIESQKRGYECLVKYVKKKNEFLALFYSSLGQKQDGDKK